MVIEPNVQSKEASRISQVPRTLLYWAFREARCFIKPSHEEVLCVDAMRCWAGELLSKQHATMEKL